MARYFVDTEHIRGERRIYWVADRSYLRTLQAKPVTQATNSKKKAEAECDRLNRDDVGGVAK